MNKGGTIELSNEITVTMVNADHSGGCPGSADGSCLQAGGASAGYIISIADCPSIYHAGDSNGIICFDYNFQIVQQLTSLETCV